MARSLGIRFYTGTMFPKQYQNVAFIARHGSWNREQKYGYDVVIAKISGHKAKIEPFMTGLLNNEKNEFYGRPTYVYPMPDGSLLQVGRVTTNRSTTLRTFQQAFLAISGAVIDRFGLFGVDQIALSWPRLLGIVLLGAGAALSLVR